MDQAEDEAMVQILENGNVGSLRISAHTGLGLDKLVESVRAQMRSGSVRVRVTVDAADGRTLALLDRCAQIHERQYGDRTVEMDLSIGRADLARLRNGDGLIEVLDDATAATPDAAEPRNSL
jgi:50S ribosomal subunit-associated GTPase HflX